MSIDVPQIESCLLLHTNYCGPTFSMRHFFDPTKPSADPVQEACMLAFTAIREGSYAEVFTVPFIAKNLLNFDKDDEWTEGSPIRNH